MPKRSGVFHRTKLLQTNEEPDILYLKSRKYGKHSITGDILESDAARADLDVYLTHDGQKKAHNGSKPSS